MGGSVVVDSLFIVAPIVCGGSVFGSCFVMQYFVYFLVSEEERFLIYHNFFLMSCDY